MKATAKGVKVSTRKVRLVADAIRNMSVKDAMRTLAFTRKHGAYVLEKALQSAVSNAVINNKAQEENLVISELIINEGQFLKRFHTSTRGRIRPYKKRTTHVTVVLKEKEVKAVEAVKKAESKEKSSPAKATEEKKEETK